MKELITYQTEGGIATLTLNDPESLNAMDENMGVAFGQALDKVEKDESVRVVILTGSGRAFSSGGNLQMIEDKIVKTAEVNKKELTQFYKTFLRLREIKVPVIAAINGHAVGAGFCVSLACDLRYAADTAKMGANFAKIGLAPGMGGTFLITRLLGPTRAAEVLLLAELLSADHAHRIGLLNGVFAPDQLLNHVRGVAKVIAANGPVAVAMIKKGIQKALNSTLEEMFDYDSSCQAESFKTADIKEGIRAIQEKRSPVFTGK